MRRLKVWLLPGLISILSGCQDTAPNGLQPLDQAAFTLPQVFSSNGGNMVDNNATLSITSGRKTKLGFYWQPQNADCSLQAGNALNVSSQAEPQHGKLWAQPTQDYPAYPPDSPSYKCNKIKISGLDVYYIPDSGFVGGDHAGYTINWTTGYKYAVNLTINVYPSALLTHLNNMPPGLP